MKENEKKGEKNKQTKKTTLYIITFRSEGTTDPLTPKQLRLMAVPHPWSLEVCSC